MAFCTIWDRPLNESTLAAAAAAWGWSGAQAELVATRENWVYKIGATQGPVALRMHRWGLRSEAELRSELQWMAMLGEQGLKLPRPLPALNGALLCQVEGVWIDALTWTCGVPLGRDGVLADLPDARGIFRSLGRTMAQLHQISDAWSPPSGFQRHAWDADGLVGEEPVWGRFWEHPHLKAEEAACLRHARELALTCLASSQARDYGLIHADLVPENVILDQGQPQLIDFDDGGWGFRLFDLATSMNRADRAVPDGRLSQALIEGYLAERDIDLRELDLFRALRTFTYVGWIMPRLGEAGAQVRSARFVDAALKAATQLIADAG